MPTSFHRGSATLDRVGRDPISWFHVYPCRAGPARGQGHLAVRPRFRDRIAARGALLAVAGLAGAGVDPNLLAEALPTLTKPPGRLEVVAVHGDVTFMVDTAHNPAALRVALRAVRERDPVRVIVVFGAGGNRDREKRPQMGRVAAEEADLVVLTDDNPRSEHPAAIRRQVRAGCPAAIEVGWRADAIRAAVEMARPGDLVLVAGKGDETTIQVGGRQILHDDRATIRAALAHRR